MDVTCERCGTAYEFDETLLSGRGTSVKCTNCGHVFRVYPSVDRTTSNWRIRFRDGSIETIETLNELQQRITHGELSLDDEIARGNEPWKRLGAIAELETFFSSADATHGSGPRASRPISEPSRSRQGTLLGAASIASGRSTLPPTGVAPPPEPQTIRHSSKPVPAPVPAPSIQPSIPPTREPLKPETAPPNRRVAPSSAPPGESSAYVEEEEEEDFLVIPGKRTNKGLWIAVALVALGAIGVASQWERLAGSTEDRTNPPIAAQAPAPATTTQAAETREPAPPKEPEAPPPKPIVAKPAPPPAPPPAPAPAVKAPVEAPPPQKSTAASADGTSKTRVAKTKPEPAPDAFVDGRPTQREYEAHLKQANDALAAGSLDRARMYFESALEARPESAAATDGLASVALKSGNPTLALRYLRASARRGDVTAYYRMGKLYRSMGQKEQAVAAYYTYLKREPGGAFAKEARSAIKAIEPYAALPPDPNADAAKPEPKPGDASTETKKAPDAPAEASPDAESETSDKTRPNQANDPSADEPINP